MIQELQARERAGAPIRVGVVGAGVYGVTLVAQLQQVPGMTASVVCDAEIDRAVQAYRQAGVDDPLVLPQGTPGLPAVKPAERRPVAVACYRRVLEGPVDVVVDCTGDPSVGCEIAHYSLQAGKHVVMVNVEADVTAGLELAAQASRAGVVYTLADGDQPSLAVGLAEWAGSLGFQVATVGKWTDAYASETDGLRRTGKKSPTRSDVTFLDGTKAQVEMAAAANALGMSVDVPGMHGLSVPIDEIPARLRPRDAGGDLDAGGVVEYVNCVGLPPGEASRYAGGVFAVLRSGAAPAMAAMASKGVIVTADRTHALVYRPYHLLGAETPWSVAMAAVRGEPTAAPRSERTVDVVAVAKRGLAAGETLRGMGWDQVRGVAVAGREAAEADALPVGLAGGCRLQRDVAGGEWVALADVEPPAESLAWRLRYSGMKNS
jgi:predicted homoserine dehydrogenase-like protein